MSQRLGHSKELRLLTIIINQEHNNRTMNNLFIHRHYESVNNDNKLEQNITAIK